MVVELLLVMFKCKFFSCNMVFVVVECLFYFNYLFNEGVILWMLNSKGVYIFKVCEVKKFVC